MPVKLLEKAKDVQDFAEDTDVRVTTLETVMAELKNSASRNEELEAQIIQFGEKIKTLTVAAKAKGEWKNGDTKEARQYGIGSFIQSMVKGHDKTASEKVKQDAHKDIMQLGGTPVKSLSSTERDGWKKTKSDMFLDEATQKAGASTVPLTSDDSVGSYYGSYLVPVQYERELMRIADEASVMMGRVTEIPMTGITAYIPRSTSQLEFTKLTNQATAKTEDTAAFSRATLTANVYAGWVAITEEMDEDSIINLGQFIFQLFGEAYGLKYDDLCLNDSTYGAINLADNVYDIGSQTGAGLTVAKCAAAIKELTKSKYRRGAEFFMNMTNFDTLSEERNANGDYVLRAPADNAPYRIKGRNVVETEALPDYDSTTANTKFALFGNPKHIIVGKRVGLELRIFDQTQSTMEYDQIYLRARFRLAATTLHPQAMVAMKTKA